MKKYAKQIFFDNLEFTMQDLNTTDPRQYWKIIKMLVKENANNCETIPPLRKTDSTYTFTDKEKAEALNNYFVSISTVDDSHETLPDFTPRTQAKIDSIHVTEHDITDIILKLNVHKASGPDEFSHRMLKETATTICKPLCMLFNRSLLEGDYPSKWKKANVMPLFKKGDRDQPSNYRPISLISCIGKVLERVVFKHVYNHLHLNNLIYKKQSGFIPGHSTVYQLIDIYNQICKAIDERKHTCIVFCDISKAFDRVWHLGLLYKLKQNGIEGSLHNWFRHYHTNRSQKVFVGTSYSESKLITAGVPQGSVLGPLLFLIYVNDIADKLISTTRLFADDSSLAVSSSDMNTIELNINHDLNELAAWAKQWLVTFNPSKTDAMICSLARYTEPSLYFNDIQLQFVQHHKHLGLTLSHRWYMA